MLFYTIIRDFVSEKYLPIRYAPLQFEFELVGNVDEAVSGSTAFEISNVQLKCDLVTLDNNASNSYDEHLLNGGNLPINFCTYTTGSQLITDIVANINVQRTFTRMKAVYVSLSTDSKAVLRSGNEIDTFYHPMTASAASYDFDRELEFGMQIGNHRFPEYPIRSVAEASTQLRKLLSKYGTQYTDAMNITASEYRNNKFVIGIDTEKCQHLLLDIIAKQVIYSQCLSKSRVRMLIL